MSRLTKAIALGTGCTVFAVGMTAIRGGPPELLVMIAVAVAVLTIICYRAQWGVLAEERRDE